MTEPDDNTISRLSGTAAQMPVPTDGLARIDARVQHRHRRRVVERSIAGVAAAVILVGAIVLVGGRRDEDGLPVVTEPAPAVDSGAERSVAPAGTDWSVSQYTANPGGPDETSYDLQFKMDGTAWQLTGLAGEGPDSLTQLGQGAIATATTPSGISVELTRDPDPQVAWPLALWDDPEGGPMMLGLTGGPSLDIELSAPTTDQILAIIDLLEPVDDATWLAALMPPDGVVDPVEGLTTNRPLRLGLPDDGGETSLMLASPWTQTISRLSLRGLEMWAVELRVRSDEGPPATGTPVQVRGVEGIASTSEVVALAAGPEGVDTSDLSGTRVLNTLTWNEGGSWIEMTFPESVGTEEAIVIANSLVVLDDEQWTALLFPDESALDLPDGSTNTTTPGDPPDEPSGTSLSAVDDRAAFCREATLLQGERPESYVGSAEHIEDTRRLVEVAPPDLREDVEQFLAFLESGFITDDYQTKDFENWPSDVRAPVRRIQVALQAC